MHTPSVNNKIEHKNVVAYGGFKKNISVLHITNQLINSMKLSTAREGTSL
jgi:hypothetical protein